MKDISFQEKELKILREAVDNANTILGEKMVKSDNIKLLINILENFIRSNKCLCYGGTAINNILPEQDKFYNRNSEIPDYDFFCPDALQCAKKLADTFFKEGYTEIEAKAGIHNGTYKVYVNFIPLADITYLDKSLFNNLLKKSIKINGISYCPPDFLRMSMYLELSRPMGDVSRWEKVLKRLILLNKNYPLKGNNCKNKDFVRISKPTGVKGIKKYVARAPGAGSIFSEFENKAPVGVKAAVRYNDLLKFKGLDKKHTQIVEGDKIKWVYLRDNPYKIDTMGFLDFDLPKPIRKFIEEYVDIPRSFDTILKNKLESFYEDLGWGNLTLNTYVQQFFKF